MGTPGDADPAETDSAETQPPARAADPRHVPGKGFVWMVRAAAAVAVALSAYLMWVSFHGRPAGCGGSSGCASVLTSRWSRWLGVPVVVPALAVHASILMATLAPQRSRRNALGLLTALAIMAAGAGVWFVVLQVRSTQEFCPYCLAIHACGLLIGLLVWAQLSVGQRGGPRPRLLRAGLAGLAALAALIVGQVLGPPDPQVSSAGEGQHRFSGFVPPTQAASGPSPQSFLNGAVTFDAAEFPLLGDPAAPHRLAVLADYTCPDCRAMHAMLARAHRRCGARFSVLVLPMPLDARCNPHVRNTLPRHHGACDLARLAMAVWRADPSRFAEMDAWLFTPAEPPSADAARRYAARLVGEKALRRGEADPWVDRAIRSGVRIHNTSSGDQIPKLLLPTTLVVGRVEDESQLFGLLEEEFKIKLTPP